MTSGKERSQFVVKLFFAILFTVLVTVYNSVHFNGLLSFGPKHLQTLIMKNVNSNATTLHLNKTNTTASPVPKGYLVWSENCHMPSMDPMAPHYKQDYEQQLLKHYDIGPNCTETPQLITKSFNATINAYILHINTNLKDQFINIPSGDEIQCCYRKIIRNGDKNYKLLDCKNFPQDFIVPNDTEHLTVECSGVLNKTNVFYKDGMSFIQDRLHVNEKIRNNTQTGRRFGILLFGIDTLSQFNFRRVMPKTFAYIQNHSWFELSGYNKQFYVCIRERTFHDSFLIVRTIVNVVPVQMMLQDMLKNVESEA